MMMSMFASVSGLKAHQTRMDVIGNNIANVNTVGFKASRTTFQEIFSQTLSSASSPDSLSGRGGTNPLQIGLGMNVDSIDVQMGRGSVQRTESPTDLSIEGEGFFIVRSGNEGPYNFTRAGNFTIDKLGNLVTATGQNVYGWMKYEYTNNGYEFDTQEPLRAINLYNDIYNMNKRIIAARVTTEAVLAGNLDATRPAIGGNTGSVTGSASLDSLPYDAVDATGASGADGIPDEGAGTTNIDPHFTVPVNVYDELGNEYKITVKFWKNFVDTSGTSPETSWYYVVDGGNNSTTSANGYIKFDSKGRIITNDTAFDVRPTITLQPNASTGADEFDFELNFEQLTMYSDDSSVKATRVDGYPPGTLVTFSIGGDGIITGVYDNGRQQPLGQIALATFENPAGLEKVGANQFSQTTNSGDFTTGKQPGKDGAGVLIPGTLEMSNVDLAKQFTEMIITQRGFQANSRVMTTSDEILQELSNIKR
ncbi:MAG: flagellar hook protein FlgE [Clostridiaceae bacterium]|nr:flagellar hook protein FlgE [Clostridiaceae bacterium]